MPYSRPSLGRFPILLWLGFALWFGFKPGVPVSWVIGKSESAGLQHLGKPAYDQLPCTLGATFAEVDGDHGATPSNAAGIVVAWLKVRSDK